MAAGRDCVGYYSCSRPSGPSFFRKTSCLGASRDGAARPDYGTSPGNPVFHAIDQGIQFRTQTASGLSSKIGTARGIALEQSTVSSIAELAINAIPGIARFAVLALGAWWIISGEWTLGSLIAFQAYLGYVFGPASSFRTANLGFQNALASVEETALLDVRPEKNLETGKKVQKLGGDIEFRNVSFSYGGLEQSYVTFPSTSAPVNG